MCFAKNTFTKMQENRLKRQEWEMILIVCGKWRAGEGDSSSRDHGSGVLQV